jgi:hypothetical protein
VEDELFEAERTVVFDRLKRINKQSNNFQTLEYLRKTHFTDVFVIGEAEG